MFGNAGKNTSENKYRKRMITKDVKLLLKHKGNAPGGLKVSLVSNGIVTKTRWGAFQNSENNGSKETSTVPT